MLSKKYRLKNKAAFAATYNQKNRVSDDFFVLYGGKEKTTPDFPTKIGFVVSKKVSKRAVKRNRIKRLAREVVRLGLKEGKLGDFEKRMSYIFFAKNRALELDFKGAQFSILKLINKISNKKYLGVL